jgi:hypothetical protein
MKTIILFFAMSLWIMISGAYAQKGINLSLTGGSYVQNGYTHESEDFFTQKSHGILTSLGISYGFNDKVGLMSGISEIECIMFSVYHGSDGFDHMYPQYSILQVPLDGYYLMKLKKNENLYFRYTGGIFYNFNGTVSKISSSNVDETKKTFNGNVKFNGGLGASVGLNMGYDLKRWGMFELGGKFYLSPNYGREITLSHTTEYSDNSTPAVTSHSDFRENSASLNMSLYLSYTLSLNKLKKKI